jgi:prepilin-type processing-associated H-X9-DG protein
MAVYYDIPLYYYIGRNAELTCPEDRRETDQYFYYNIQTYGVNANICGYPGVAYADYGPHKVTRYAKNKVTALEDAGDPPGSLFVKGTNSHYFYDYQCDWKQLPIHNGGCNKLWLDGGVNWSKAGELPSDVFKK